jgi:lipid-A-disaccharide synthase
MKILFSAAEASSDTHAAEVLSRLRKIATESGFEAFEAFGVGGPKLRAAGLEAIVPAEDLLAMGLVEILSRLPKIRRHLVSLETAARSRRPDVAVLCDYPDFHFRLARRLKSLGIPVVCYIPPKVWAWRRGRLRTLAELYSRVLSILPFERETYAASDVAYEYVGNPLIDELPMGLTRAEARAAHGIGADEEVLLLMVGSRPSELKYHLKPMLEAAGRVQEARRSQGKPFRVLVPLPETAAPGVIEQRIAELSVARGLSIRVSYGDAWKAMKAADVGIIKSGTSSLEAAVLDCPHVVVYRAHPISEWAFRKFVRYTGAISLTNLILADGAREAPRVVRELILADFGPERMAEEALVLFLAGSRRESVLASFEKLRCMLRGTDENPSPSATAARAILQVARDAGNSTAKGNPA